MRRTAMALIALCALSEAAVAQDSSMRAAIIVNDQVITGLTFDQRVKLALIGMDQPDTKENRDRITPQIEQALIDEAIQVQEAERLGIEVDESEIQATIQGIAESNGLTPPQLRKELEDGGVLPSYLADQVRARLLWRNVVSQRLFADVNVTPDRIEAEVARIEERGDEPQRLLAEIYLAADGPGDFQAKRQEAQQLVQRIQSGVSFAELARQYSDSVTASSGGDLGWVDPGELPIEVETVLSTMAPGQLSSPIETPTGIYLIVVRNERLPPAIRITLEFRELAWPVQDRTDEAEINQKAAIAFQAKSEIFNCDNIDSVVRRYDGRVVAGETETDFAALAPYQRSITRNLEPGQTSDLFPGPEGISFIVLCAREDAGVDRELVRRRLIQEELDARAERLMRDLRRQATIEIRR